MTNRMHCCLGRVLILGLVVGVLAGCSVIQDERFETTGNPLLDLRNPDLLERDRIAAARQAWDEVERGVRVRERTRQALKNLAWSSATEPELRLVVLDLLMSDTSEEGSADSKRMARLLLPTEKSPAVVRVLCERSVENGWSDLVPAIVRSYSRLSPNVPDMDRDERRAIEALRPGQPIESVVFETFLDPAAGLADEQERAVLRVSERVRGDAWGLLSRLDPDRTLRRELLRRGAAGRRVSPETEGLLADLREVDETFGIVPETGMELEWLTQILRNGDDERAAANRVWWGEASSAVGRLGGEQREGLELRHLEAIRWVASEHPEWLSMDRSGLRRVLSDRLSRREHHKRKAAKGEPRRLESLSDWSSVLDWADLLTILAVDEAVMERSVVEQLFVQRDLDREDEKTEYGGVLDADDEASFRAVLFRPRARDRVSDERFVASDDMMRFSDRSLAHYHFHANNRNNAKYAGPSLGDFLNAHESGRTCVVLTSMGSRELNADLYQPDGVVIDLGKIVRE